MCGIAGLWISPQESAKHVRDIARGMAVAIRHRGPDGAGVWSDDEAGIALAHRRLSILDLSAAGAQPMEDASGRFLIVFNGEIYNHLEIRRNLEHEGAAPPWRGHSDTETLIAAISAWGLIRALEQICGMFAFALWDKSNHRLTLARDRLGEKPIYYGWSGGDLLFGSELKAFMAYPGFDNPVDPQSIAAFLRYSYVPETRTIFRNVYKLGPGQYIEFSSPSAVTSPESYWSIDATILRCAQARLNQDYTELLERVETQLKEVIASQILSDVPLGCFLSGGVDSSLVAALMQTQSSGKVRTFSIGFEERRFNEAHYARQVANVIGTEHTEFTVTPTEALAVVPDLPQIYDEPFADPSQIPTILLSRLTREHVTVALSGDGGDEIFGGYNRHTMAPNLWRRLSLMPNPVRRLLGRSMVSLQSFGTGSNSFFHNLVDYLGLPISTVDKLSKFGGAIDRANSFEELYFEIVSTFDQPTSLVLNPCGEAERKTLAKSVRAILGDAEWAMAMDCATYLPGDILVKVDRAAMSASLETRAPFLDRRIVELAWMLPIGAKFNGGVGKRILRDILSRYVPRELQERPKQGFAIPLDTWLRRDLREWAESVLSPDKLLKTGVFDPEHIQSLWHSHQSGKDNAGWRLWSILMMQSWLLNYTCASARQVLADRCAPQP